MSAERELTFGEKAAGVDFNPSGDPEVAACKAAMAQEIDRLHAIRSSDDCTPERARHCSIAITQLETAQMRAVKAITFRH